MPSNLEKLEDSHIAQSEDGEVFDNPKTWISANRAAFYIDRVKLNVNSDQSRTALNFIGSNFLSNLTSALSTSEDKNCLFIDPASQSAIETIEICERIFFFLGAQIGGKLNAQHSRDSGDLIIVESLDTNNKWKFFQNFDVEYNILWYLSFFISGKFEISDIKYLLSYNLIELDKKYKDFMDFDKDKILDNLENKTWKLKFKSAANRYSVGKELRELRVEARMTIAEVAEVMGTGPRAVHRIERGEQNTSVEMVQRYADAVGCCAEVHFRTKTPEINNS